MSDIMWSLCLTYCLDLSVLDSISVAPVVVGGPRLSSPTLLSIIRWLTKPAMSSLSISTPSAKMNLSSCKPGPTLLSSVRYHRRSGQTWAVLPCVSRVTWSSTTSHIGSVLWLLTSALGKRKMTDLAMAGRGLKLLNRSWWVGEWWQRDTQLLTANLGP